MTTVAAFIDLPEGSIARVGIHVKPRLLTPSAVENLINWLNAKPYGDHDINGAPVRGLTPGQCAAIFSLAPSTRARKLSLLIGAEGGRIGGAWFQMVDDPTVG